MQDILKDEMGTQREYAFLRYKTRTSHQSRLCTYVHRLTHTARGGSVAVYTASCNGVRGECFT